MLKAITTTNFSAEPCYFKNKLHLSRKNEACLSLIFIKSEEINELIQLLQNAKEQFK